MREARLEISCPPRLNDHRNETSIEYEESAADCSAVLTSPPVPPPEGISAEMANVLIVSVPGRMSTGKSYGLPTLKNCLINSSSVTGCVRVADRFQIAGFAAPSQATIT